MICSIASQSQWAIRAGDIAQAFFQPPNPNPKDRVIVIPPSTIHSPWTGKPPPMNQDVSKATHRRGFLLLLPLYGGLDAPMRRFTAPPKRLMGYGFAQMQTDVCISPKRDSQGELTGVLISHAGGLLLCGTPGFRKRAIQAIMTFTTGELSTISKETPSSSMD